MKEVKIGLTNSIELTITEHQSAIHVGSGDVNVLGSPAMIAYMERTAVEMMRPYFEENETSVGTHISVDHKRATAIGEKVTFYAKLVGVEEQRKLTFDIWAEDAKGEIGRGKLCRSVIDRQRFMAKLGK